MHKMIMMSILIIILCKQTRTACMTDKLEQQGVKWIRSDELVKSPSGLLILHNDDLTDCASHAKAN